MRKRRSGDAGDDETAHRRGPEGAAVGPEGTWGVRRVAMLPYEFDDEEWDEVVHEIVEGMI